MFTRGRESHRERLGEKGRRRRGGGGFIISSSPTLTTALDGHFLYTTPHCVPLLFLKRWERMVSHLFGPHGSARPQSPSYSHILACCCRRLKELWPSTANQAFYYYLLEESLITGGDPLQFCREGKGTWSSLLWVSNFRAWIHTAKKCNAEFSCLVSAHIDQPGEPSWSILKD